MNDAELRPGSNEPQVAWQAAVLVDGANYFATLRAALLDARHSVLIAGWDIDSRTIVRGVDDPDDGAPLSLGPLLAHLARRRPTLQIHVLLWDYSILYAAEREPLPRLNLNWRTPPNVHVCLDANLPIGAAHHEKLVVVDDGLAFCGGLDLTIRRWDTPAHRPDEPGRRDPGDKPYGPFHDLQMLVSGPAAQALGRIVRERWAAARGIALPSCEHADARWPAGLEPDFSEVPVRTARTRAAFDDCEALREVEAAYVDAIGRAERFIYIESQYLTAMTIADALRRRLDAVPALEALLVTSAMPSGWLEIHTMGVGRERFLARLDAPLRASRVRVVSPYVGGDGAEMDVKVHAKLMIVDDRYLQIGSSNLNNRSMALDSECDLTIDAERNTHRRAIARIRRRLMAEHLGIEPAALEALEADHDSVLAALDAAGSRSGRGFATVEAGTLTEDAVTATLSQMADPETPLDPEAFVGDLFGARRAHPLVRRATRLALASATLLALLAVWHTLSPAEWLSPEQLIDGLHRLSASAWGGPAVLALFVAGSLLVFPVTVLIAATAVAFEPWRGFVWSLAGCLLGASLGFAIGRGIGRWLYGTVLGDRIATVTARLGRGGILPVMLLRNVPLGPFTIVNIAAGVSSLRFFDYLLGTALGITPGVAALTLLGNRLRDLWQQPSATNIALVAFAVALWIAIALLLQWFSNRIARR